MDPTDLLGSLAARARHRGPAAAEETSRVHGSLVLARAGPDDVSWEEQAIWHRPDGDVVVRRTLRLALHRGRLVGALRGRSRLPSVDAGGGRRARLRAGHLPRPGGRYAAGWTIVWDVTGPGKDYTMTTVLS